jgi:hypothetical protein
MDEAALSTSQIIVQVCLFLVAAIAMFGGALQMALGQPDTTGVIALWAALTIRQQGFLIYLLALGVLLAGVGRLVSITKVGLPKPTGVWVGYLIPELVLPVIIAVAHRASQP